MTMKPGGLGERVCDVCGRSWTWGCGHSGSQEYAARRHRLTRKHREGRCECFSHEACDPTKCSLAGPPRAGYAPWYSHAQIAAGDYVVDGEGRIHHHTEVV